MVTSVLMGLLGSSIFFLVVEPWYQVVETLSTTRGLSNWLALVFVTSAPLTVPVGLVGGVLAARILNRKRQPSSLGRWAIRGCLSGFVLGTLGPFIVGALNYLRSISLFNLPMLGTKEIWLSISIMAFVGAFTGAGIGTIVGLYAGRIEHGADATVASGIT
jgi:hypothetical protein